MSGTNQFNTANNAGFVNAYIGALTSYIKPLNTIAQEISGQTGVTCFIIKPDGSTAHTQEKSNATIIQGASALALAGNSALSAISTYNSTDPIDTPSAALFSKFQDVVGAGITFTDNLKILEEDYFYCYGTTLGFTGESPANSWNMSTSDILDFYSTWTNLNNTISSSSNAFSTWISQNMNSFIGSTGRAQQPYNGISTISSSYNTVAFDSQSLDLFLSTNSNSMERNGVVAPSFPTYSQYVAATIKYNKLQTDLTSLIDGMSGFIGDSGLASTTH
jgi:hypothetical protein